MPGESGLRFVVVTNLWPGPRKPAWGSFVANRVDALRRLGHEVEVLAVSDSPSPLARYGGLLEQVVRRRSGPPCDVVEAHIAYPTGLFAQGLARRLGVPLVLFAHGSDVLRAPGRSRLDAELCRRLFDRAALVIANTDYLAAEVESRLGVEPSRIAVCSPGIRYTDFAGARQRSGGRPYELLFVGNLIHRKAVDVLLDALAAMPDTPARPALRVVGDGPERAALEGRARAAGLDVAFVGARTQEEVAGEMASALLLAVPSREEALGLVALEGMAAGAVPVVSSVGGLAATVTEGVTGFGCPAEDPQALAAALRRALDAVSDTGRLTALRAAGDAVAREHDVDTVTARTVELMRATVEAR